jgi:DMSO/TMAO reductase YedYZ molybdopterin-dependent catalytic subunit
VAHTHGAQASELAATKLFGMRKPALVVRCLSEAQDGEVHRRDERDAARATRWWAWLAGAVAGLAGIAIAGLAAWLVAPAGNPVSAVGELIINLLPGPLVNFGKDTLGTADKPVLLAIITTAVLILCAIAGQLELRRRFAGAAIFAIVAVLGMIGIAAQPNVTFIAYVPTIVGLLLGYMILNTLVGKLQEWRSLKAEAKGGQAQSAARRTFLAGTVLVGALAAIVAVGGQLIASASSAVDAARQKLRLPTPAKPAAAPPPGADFQISGLAPYVTPNGDFYRIDTALQVPVIDPVDWTLKITGMVQNPIKINYAELTAKPLVEHLTTLTCVSNEVGGDLAGNALWLGYPVRELLAEAKPLEGADMVLSTSDDGWTASTPLSALTDPNRAAMLAIGMNGEPLPIEHGFPVRMVVPGLYGYVSATKWVTELKVTSYAEDKAYWTPLGWSARAPIKLASRIDVPRKSTIDAGTVVVAGVAWAQHTGIGAVEVQVDQNGWQPAQLAETAGPDTWRQWRFEWTAVPGKHTLTVRASDADGKVQTANVAPPMPDGATGYHSIEVKVR